MSAGRRGPRRRNRPGAQDGLTLLEAVAALLILSIFASCLLPAFSQFIMFNNHVTVETQVLILARGKLEEIIAGVERAQEGYFPEPWSHYRWRYQEEKAEERLARHLLNVHWRGFLSDQKFTVCRVQAR